MAEIVSTRIKKLQAGPRTLSGDPGGNLNQNSVVATLTLDSCALPANSDGVVTSYSAAVTTMKIQVGGKDDTANWTISRTNSAGVTSDLVGATLTVTSLVIDLAYVELTATRAGFSPVTKRFSLSRVRAGADGVDGGAGGNPLRADLSNEVHTVPANADGSNPNLTGASTTVFVFNGDEDDTANWACTATPSAGVTGTLSGKTYTVTGFTADSGYVDFTLTRTGFSTLTARFTLTKVKAGADGTPATVYRVEPSVNHIKKTQTGTLLPASVTFNAYSVTGNAARVAYAGRFVIETSTNGSTWSTAYTSLSNESSATYSPANTMVAVRAKLHRAGATPSASTLVDQESVLIVADGIDGAGAGVGTDGEDGQAFWMVTSSAAIGKTNLGTYLPNALTVTAYRGLGITTPSVYAARFRIETTTDGTTWTHRYTSAADQTTYTYSPIPAGITAVRARMYYEGGTSVMLDEEIVPIVTDGANGVSGDWTSYVFREAATKPATPTGTAVIPTGWLDAPPSNYTNPVWMSKATISGTLGTAGAWSSPIQVTGLSGQDGADGQYTVFQYAKNTSLTNPPTTNWSSSPGLLSTGEYQWMRAGVVTPPSTTPVYGTPYRVSGEKGADGDGKRGSLTGYGKQYGIYTSTWSDNSVTTDGAQYANAVIWNMLNGTSIASTTTITHLRIGDTVTLTNAASPTSAITKYWGGSAWLNPGQVINGNLFVTGTVSASYLNVGTTSGGVSVGYTNPGSSTKTNGIFVYQNSDQHYGLFVENVSTGGGAAAFRSTGGYTLEATIVSPSEGAAAVVGAISGSATGRLGARVGGNNYAFHGSGPVGVFGPLQVSNPTSTYAIDATAGLTRCTAGFVGPYLDGAGGNAVVKTGSHGLAVQTDGQFVYYKSGALWWVAPNQTSDLRLKENVADTTMGGLATVNALRVVDYTWKLNSPSYDHGKVHTGFIAQEAEVVIPDAVKTVADTKMMYKDEIVPALVKAIQELHAELLQVKADLAALQNGGV